MTSTTRALARVATAALALTAGGLATVAAPASAASFALTYSCTSSADAFTHDFSAVVDTNAPPTLGSTLSTSITVTSDVTVPEELADTLRGLGVATVDGTSQATGTVDGVSRTSTLTIPKTAVTADGVPMHVLGSGPGGSITAGAVGSTILLGAGNFTATLTGYNTAGTVVVPATTFTCSLEPATGQDLLVDKVNVVQAPTTTTLTVSSPVDYGAVPSVSADVSWAGGNQKPAGKIAFTYAGKTVTVDVKGGKAKADLAPALTMGANHVTAVFTPTETTLAPSQSGASFTVVRDHTTTTASAVYRAPRHRLVGKATVEAVNGTDVAGQVRIVLKRDGVKIRSAVVGLSSFDKAKKVFQHISKIGTYTVVTRYLGSPTLRRSVDRTKLAV